MVMIKTLLIMWWTKLTRNTYRRKITYLQSGNRGRDSEIMRGLIDDNKSMLKEAMGPDGRSWTLTLRPAMTCSLAVASSSLGWHKTSSAWYECRCLSCCPRPFISVMIKVKEEGLFRLHKDHTLRKSCSSSPISHTEKAPRPLVKTLNH